MSAPVLFLGERLLSREVRIKLREPGEKAVFLSDVVVVKNCERQIATFVVDKDV